MAKIITDLFDLIVHIFQELVHQAGEVVREKIIIHHVLMNINKNRYVIIHVRSKNTVRETD